MDIPHRPDLSTLMTCAAGSQPEALCAVITSCLAMCPASMEMVTRMELIGVALLDQMDPEPMSEPPAKALAGAERSESNRNSHSSLPAPLRAVVGDSIDALGWLDREQGVKYFSVPMSPTAQGRLELVNLAPGTKLPELAYAGEEYLLVVSGSCSRDGTRLERGDFVESYEQSPYSLVAGDNGHCVLLIGHERLPNQPIRH